LYSKGVDFSQSSNKQIIVNLATPMGMTSATAGSGVVILSTIQQVYPADCTAAGISGGSCTNSGKDVITNRIVIGNSSYTSQYGTPSSSLIDSQGDLSTGSSSTHGYLNDSSAVATGFSNLLTAAGLTLADNQVAYLSEAYFTTPDVSYLGGPASGGVYAKTIF
jgi:hypothetical protein